MIESQSNPGLPSSQYPWPNSRRLDIGRIGADGKLSKIFDVKFPGDSLGEAAAEDYREIAKRQTGSTDNFEEFKVDQRCNCDDDEPPQHPVPAIAPEPKKSFIDKYGDALQAATGVALTGWALWGVLIISEGTRVIPARNAIPIP